MKKFQVTALTGAIVDILSHVDQSFLKKYQIPKVQHRLIDKQESEYLYSIIPQTIQQSGGSLSNTLSSLSSLGINSCCMAKVFDDGFGKTFLHDMSAVNINFPVSIGNNNVTGHSIILINPDAERIMNTHLGGVHDLGPQDLCEKSLGSTEYFCGEAYSWPNIDARNTLMHAVKIAKQAGSKIVFCLSAEGCLEGHQAEIINYIKQNVDILIGNILEYKALLKINEDSVAQHAKDLAPITVVTKGKKGSVVFQGADAYDINPVKPAKIVDTTGAGDAYTAGFLYGLITKRPLYEAGRYASLFASGSITQTGARPCIKSLKSSINKSI